VCTAGAHAEIGDALLLLGQAREALKRLVTEPGDSSLYQRAQVRAQRQERDTALAVRARARGVRRLQFVSANTDALLAPLRPLPAFGELLRQAGFV
jgi:hypothetical protein